MWFVLRKTSKNAIKISKYETMVIQTTIQQGDLIYKAILKKNQGDNNIATY
jgi:hypothetical protein